VLVGGVDLCSHGAESEVTRKVIPESPTSHRGIIELSPPKLYLTRLTPSKQTSQIFDFSISPRQTPKATAIVVSKADSISSLEVKIRKHLPLPLTSDLRAYRLSNTALGDIPGDIPITSAKDFIDDVTPLDFSLKSRTIGEIGLVEPTIGIAIDPHTNEKWLLEDEMSTEKGVVMSDVQGGRTLGAQPNSFTALNRRSNGTNILQINGANVLEKNGRNVLEESDEEGGIGMLNGKVIAGPPLPGSYPVKAYRSETPVGRGSFNARFAPLPKEETPRVRGITGLNNLGTTTQPPSIPNLSIPTASIPFPFPCLCGGADCVCVGNSCYMNSALQCLVHCKELTEYFLAQVYKSELNETNPLGMNGLLAKHYAWLVAALFNPLHQKPSFPPSEFKKTIGTLLRPNIPNTLPPTTLTTGRFAPNFSGYSQQDSQEFLACLLDGLHEDLNRVRKKPYVERDELIGVEPSDEQLREMGQKAWDGHKLRNDSVVVDLCVGMYKSTVVCPVCDVVSVTFDPFMDLSVPLPIKQM
jgi:Ubiquitin carboxyl-terminal hydrolase